MASGPWARGWSTEQSGRAGLSCADESASGRHGEVDGSDPWGRSVSERGERVAQGAAERRAGERAEAALLGRALSGRCEVLGRWGKTGGGPDAWERAL